MHPLVMPAVSNGKSVLHPAHRFAHGMLTKRNNRPIELALLDLPILFLDVRRESDDPETTVAVAP